MFDFAWSEFALIAVVALIAIGPKDMPVAIRTVTSWIKKARRMAAEFQTHVDEMVREADLSEVRASINEIRNFDIRGEIERTVDADGSIRATFASNPLQPSPPKVTPIEEIDLGDTPVAESAPSDLPPAVPAQPEALANAAAPSTPQAPAFVPPNLVRSAAAPDAVEPEPPAFIPPNAVQWRRAHLSN
jgi:sec-independent protein translocase protein TatB